MNHNRHLYVGIYVTVLMIASLYFGLSQHPSSFDDAYITYRYARNIAQGRGFVYNSGQPVLGTTTPLYTLLLAGLSLIWQDIPTLSHVMGVVFWMLCVPVTYGIARVDDHEYVGLVAASLMAVNALFLDTLGMETPLYVLTILLSFCFSMSDYPAWAGVCAGLAFLTRWDGILVIGILVLAAVLRRDRQFSKTLLVSACLILPWLAYSHLTFGSIFPNTLFAKAGQGWKEGLGGTEIGPFPRGLVSIARSAYGENPLFLLPAGLSIVGALSAFRNTVKWWPIVLWTAAYFGSYTVLGVLQFPWYYPPLVPAFLLLAGTGVEELTERLPQNPKCLQLSFAALLIALCLKPNVDWLMAKRRTQMNRHLATYVDVGEWLKDHTPSDSSVATIEIGVIGFFSDRTIVDTMGLVSPEMVGHLESWLQTLQFAINHYWPDYAVALEGTAWGGVIHSRWFREAYVLETEIENLANPDAPMTIYRRRDGFPPDEFAVASTRQVHYNGKFALHEFRIAEGSASPGDILHVQLIWQALADLDTDYSLQFDLVNGSDGRRRTLASGVQPMQGGNPTSLWNRGDTIVDTHPLQIPADAEPGAYLMQLILQGSDSPPAMIDEDGTSVKYVAAGPVQIGNASIESSLPRHMENVTFGDNISLLGYDIRETGAGQVEVTLYWEATGAVSQDYTAFVHLMSPEGELITQHDSPPRLATQLWIPGIPVVDSHLVSLPSSSFNVNYEVWAGMYSWPDIKRVPVVSASGRQIEDDAVLLRHTSLEYP